MIINKKKGKFVVKVNEAFLLKKFDERFNMERYLLSSIVNYSDRFEKYEDALAYAEECRQSRMFKENLFICEIKQIGNYYNIKEVEEIQAIPIIPINAC